MTYLVYATVHNIYTGLGGVENPLNRLLNFLISSLTRVGIPWKRGGLIFIFPQENSIRITRKCP